MIFDLLDYIFGSLKMIIIKIFYLNRLKVQLIGKYSRTVQIRIFNSSKIISKKNLLMRSGVKIRTNKNGILNIGENVGLNNNCLINCMDSITIGDNVIFGQSVKIYDHDHNYKKDGVIRDNGYITSPIIINDNVWIGSNCIILKGTEIGANSVIGANTVVYGKIPRNSIVYSDRQLKIKKKGELDGKQINV
ncbi:acyltransferase [Thomasclavelia ramosa]|nr:acyltransferase [Thomasclavelia ramosa]